MAGQSAAEVEQRFVERLALMFDLIALAFRADITRVASLMMAAEASSMTYDHLGVPESFHLLSHHQNDPGRSTSSCASRRFHTRMFAHFVRTLAELPDGDGSLLDRSLILFGSNMSDSHAHDHFPLPLAVIGGGCGTPRGPASAVSRPHADREPAADGAASDGCTGAIDRRQHGRVRGIVERASGSAMWISGCDRMSEPANPAVNGRDDVSSKVAPYRPGAMRESRDASQPRRR